MLNLISSHFQSSLLASGKLSLQSRLEDLLSILEDCIYLHTLDSMHRGIKIEIQSHFRPVVKIDAAYIQEVFSKFLEHAVKNAKHGSTIKILIESQGKTVQLTTSFEEETFDAMTGQDYVEDWHANSTWSWESCVKQSLNTRLPLIRQVIEQHGGTLWITKEIQPFISNYTVELPLVRMQSWKNTA